MNVYRTKEWVKIRELVIRRDNAICALCGKAIIGKLDVHHILEVKYFKELAYNIDNLVCLHHVCHNKVHRRYEKKPSFVSDKRNVDYSKRRPPLKKF